MPGFTGSGVNPCFAFWSVPLEDPHGLIVAVFTSRVVAFGSSLIRSKSRMFCAAPLKLSTSGIYA